MTEAEKAQKQDAMRKAYQEATRQLRVAHQDDFNKLYAAAAAELGYDWSPKPNPEQQAKAQIAQLLNQFPSLKAELAVPTGDPGPN